MRDGITRHGLALNVAPQMAHFDLLIPCGIADRGVTSMERELGWAPDMVEVAERFVRAFAEVFGCRVVEGDPATLFGQPRWLWRRASAEAEAAVGRMERPVSYTHLTLPTN